MAARSAWQPGQTGSENSIVQKHAYLIERVVGGSSPGWGHQLPHHAAHGCVQPIPAKTVQYTTLRMVCMKTTTLNVQLRIAMGQTDRLTDRQMASNTGTCMQAGTKQCT